MSEPTKPLVSAIIAVHNGERFLRACIESVFAQEHRPIECVLVDDGSTDGTRRVAEEFGDAVRYAWKPRGGVASARNLGISLATGELVAFLDADDVWLPEKLSRQVAVFDERPDVALVYSGYVVVDEALRPKSIFYGGQKPDEILRWLMLDSWGIGFAMNGVVRRAVVERLGGFDERFSTSADLEFCWRVARCFEVAAIREPLALYRSHPEQMHRDLTVMARDIETLYQEIFDGSDPRKRATRRRAMANLHVRVAFGHVRSGRPGPAMTAVGRALRARPDRLVGAPLQAGWRRLRHRGWGRGATFTVVPTLTVPQPPATEAPSQPVTRSEAAPPPP